MGWVARTSRDSNTRDATPAVNRSATARAQRFGGAWAAYVAFAWGLAFAAISFYWGAGGIHGLDTLGGSLERLARAHDRTIFIAVWVTGFLKVFGSLLALALAGGWAA